MVSQGVHAMLKRLLSVVALIVVFAPIAAHAQDEVVY